MKHLTQYTKSFNTPKFGNILVINKTYGGEATIAIKFKPVGLGVSTSDLNFHGAKAVEHCNQFFNGITQSFAESNADRMLGELERLNILNVEENYQ